MAAVPGAGLVLRPGVPADAASLARIHRAARAAALPGLRERWSEAEVAAWIVAGPMAARPGGVVVAEGPGRAPVGYIALDARGAEVLHLYVAPAWQGRGVGARLLAAVMAAAGPEGLALWCFRRNHGARAFYERHGFRPVAHRDEPGANEEGEPDVRYAWTPHPHRMTRTGANA